MEKTEPAGDAAQDTFLRGLHLEDLPAIWPDISTVTSARPLVYLEM